MNRIKVKFLNDKCLDNVEEYPEEYKSKLDYITKKKIEEINKEKTAIISDLTLKKANELHNGGCLGVFAGVLFFTFLLLVITWFQYTPVILICGGILSLVLPVLYYFSGSKTNEKIDKQIEEINIEYDEKIKDVLSEKEYLYVDYCARFEDKINKQSVAFSGSELAKEIINWMSKGFHKTIMSADRKSYINVISVPFSFDVYKDKIVCPLGKYDFIEKRCSFLETEIERAALASVIASEIQLNTVMSFPEDPSKTIPRVTWVKNYVKDHVSACVHYEASNGFYEAVKKWN